MSSGDGLRHIHTDWSADGSDRGQIMLRPSANPLPLGFFSFAVGMALLAGLGLGWLSSPEDVRSAGVLMAAFVFPLELVAAVFAVLSRDTAAATTLGLFTTSWLGLGLLDALDPDLRTDRSIGVFLAAFTLMLLPLMLSALFARPLLGALLGMSVLRAGFQAAYELGAPRWTSTADGITALAVLAGALYAGTAFLVEDFRCRTEPNEPDEQIHQRGSRDRAVRGRTP